MLQFTRLFTTMVCMWSVVPLALGSRWSTNRIFDCPNNHWDFFTFSQLNPAGDCSVYPDCSYPPNTSNWTIHGLWPTNNFSTTCPEFCNESATFNVNSIQDQLPLLEKYWLDLFQMKAYDDKLAYDDKCQHNMTTYLWCHEWLRHGTCATLPSLATESLFFKNVLELFLSKMKYDIFVLSKYNIVPSKTHEYELMAFVHAFEATWNVKPVMYCKLIKGKQVLVRIQTCLAKDFTMIKCPDSILYKHTCTSSYPIQYLPT